MVTTPSRVWDGVPRFYILYNQVEVLMRSVDLTEGPIFKKLVLLSLPIMGGQFMNMAYTLTDLFWLGMLSSDAVASSATAMMYLWLSLAVLLFLRAGTEIGVSQNLGRGDVPKAQAYAQNCVSLSIVLGILVAILFIVARQPLIAFFAIADAQVVTDAENFLAITALSLPMLYAGGTIAASFQASGDTRTPFLILSTGVVANMLLDPVLIFWLDMGVLGAAYATIVARMVEISLYILAVKKSPTRPFDKMRLFTPLYQKDITRDVVRWGTPVAIESAMFTVFSMIIARFVAEYGTAAIAAQRVGYQIEALSWLVGMGFGIAVTAFVGQNYGAGKFSRIHQVFRTALLSMIVYGFFISLFLFFLAEPLIGIFLQNPEEIQIGGSLLRILAFAQIPICFEAAMAACFRGRGRTLLPSIVSVSCNAVRVVGAFYLSQTPLGLDGIWIAVGLGASIRSITILLFFLCDKKNIPLEDA